MKSKNELYVIDGTVLERLEEAIAELQSIFLDIFSNHELFVEDEQ
jgi:hypothetical protein